VSKRKPDNKPKAAIPLSGGRLLLAKELAKQGIARLMPDPTIILSIVEQCHTSERSAAAALRAVVNEISELSEPERADLRTTLHFRYEALYAQLAQAPGKEEAAAKMLDRRAKLAGLFTDKGEAGDNKPPVVDEFEGRTREELVFFKEHGYWPEEKPVDNVVPIDPLARLRKQAK
jgi:hypothetical protein